MTRLDFLSAVACILPFASFAQAATFNVTTPAQLQSALTAAQSNGEHDTINVAAGTYDVDLLGNTFTYSPTENKTLNIIGAGADSTMLVSAGKTRRILLVDAAVADAGTSPVTIQDLAIHNGNTTGDGGGVFLQLNSSEARVSACTVWNNAAGGDGGGLWIRTNSGAINVTGCTFQSNVSGNSGGGLHVNTDSGRVTVDQSQFTMNEALNEGGGATLASASAGVLLHRNLIHGNSSQNLAGGAAIFSSTGGIGAFHNSVSGNISFGDAGGLFLASSSSAVGIVGNLVHMNISTTGTGGGFVAFNRGDGIFMTSNTVMGNEASIAGGGAALNGRDSNTPIDVRNNIIRGNSAPNGTDLRIDDDENVDGNLAVVKVFNNDGSPVSIRNGGSLTQGSNIDQDPQFLNAGLSDFRLAAGSPCVDTGDDGALLIPSTDLEDLPRIVDGDGNGTATVDMGAYETQPNVAASPADVDFGPIHAGEISPSQTFTIANTGSLALVIGNVSLDNSLYALQQDACSGLTLAPSETCTVQVAFAPVLLGNSPGVLRIPSNDPDTPNLDVPLSGVSTQGAVYPVRGTIGTEVILSGAGFGQKRPKVYLDVAGTRKTFRVLTFTDTEIHVRWKTKIPSGSYDLYVQPKKSDPVALGRFEIRNPEIDLGMVGGHYSGYPREQIIIFGFYFTSQKPKLTLSGGGLTKPKKCRVLRSKTYQYPLASRGESEAAIVVPNLSPGTYDFTVTTRIGSGTQTGAFQVR